MIPHFTSEIPGEIMGTYTSPNQSLKEESMAFFVTQNYSNVVMFCDVMRFVVESHNRSLQLMHLSTTPLCFLR